MLKVLVVGSGAREHAIVWKLLQSPKVGEVLVAPGNAGTGLIARNVDILAKDIEGIVNVSLQEAVGLVIVGPEDPLATGLVDALETVGIPAFGPSKAAAAIEASKGFSKSLMLKYGIPCAKGAVFSSLPEAEAYLAQQQPPVVVKADGLAAGKGVVVAQSLDEAREALHQTMELKVFGAAGDLVLIEECLTGYEVSLLAFTDGQSVVPMVPACDYKRVFDGDAGPNTGGMGAYSPPAAFGPEMVAQVATSILEPTVRALAAEGRPYRGVLYAGLMITADGPKVLEFNARFGDPETQVVLPRLRTDLVDIAFAVIEGRLDRLIIEWSKEPCVGVVMASAGYPGSYSRGIPITGLDSLDPDVIAFHAGTRFVPASEPPRARSLLRGPKIRADYASTTGQIKTDGGRVLTIVAQGQTIGEARQKVYDNLRRIQFRGAHYRHDIAARELGDDEVGSTSSTTESRGPAPSSTSSSTTPKADTVSAPSPTSPEAMDRYAKAQSLFEQGKIRETQEQLQRVLRIAPRYVEARALLGTTLLAQGKTSEAAAEWEQAVGLALQNPDAHHNLGSVYARLGKLDAAIAQFQACLALDQQFIPARLGLGAIYARRGENQNAIAQYEAALTQDPSNAEAHLDFAIVLASMGEKGKALAELNSCLALDPDEATRTEAEQQKKVLSKKRWLRK